MLYFNLFQFWADYKCKLKKKNKDYKKDITATGGGPPQVCLTDYDVMFLSILGPDYGQEGASNAVRVNPNVSNCYYPTKSGHILKMHAACTPHFSCN